jgi:hypothetical protein
MFTFKEFPDSIRREVTVENTADMEEFSKWLREQPYSRMDITLSGSFEAKFVFLTSSDRQNFCDGLDFGLGILPV